MDLTFELIPAETGVLCLYDQESGERTPKVVRSRSADEGTPVTISETIVNEALEEHKAVLVTDAIRDDRFARQASILMSNISSAICAPFYDSGLINGFIYLHSDNPASPLNRDCLEVLSTLAAMTAVAIEQAKLRDEAERQKAIRDRLARYSSPPIVQKIIDGMTELQSEMLAERVEVSVLFLDICGFTALSETMDAEQVTQTLNLLFEKFTATVFALNGTLDKFMGDGLMAIFGAPVSQANHADLAVTAALRILGQIDRVNARELKENPVRIRIGINSGSVIAGDIGSPQRKDYTVVGDTVNVASRLEKSVAEPGQVVIGARTQQLIGKRFSTESLGSVKVHGKSEPIPAFRVVQDLDATEA